MKQLKSLFGLAVVVIAIYLIWKVMPAYYTNFEYQDFVESQARIESYSQHNEQEIAEVFAKKAAELPLAGRTFVLTGTLPSMTREEATARIEALGGHVTGSVSKKTDYVLAGAEPGSKFDKAKELGLKIIDEAGLRKML